MKKIFTIIIFFLLAFSNFSDAVERRKGVTWNENLIFRKKIASELDTIPEAGNIALDYTVKSGTVYTATQNRTQAAARATELSNVSDFYVDWFWYFCGQRREITAYSPSIDGDSVVIGEFTLESAFDTDPATGTIIRLIDPDAIEETDQTVIKVSPGNQIQIGGDNDIGIIHNGSGGLVKYRVTDETAQFFPLFSKPVKTDSVSVATFCTAFSSVGAFQDPFIQKIGLFLDSVPANTKIRIYLLGVNEFNDRYPILENVTLDEFAQGLGDAVIEATYADVNTWNLTQMSEPTIARAIENFNLSFAFSDENGDPRFLDVPVDTTVTDSGSYSTVRSDDIQSASGTAITLDTNASPRNDDYNGMRLYIDDEFRDILDYNGTTKVATVDSIYTSPPSPSDAYDIKVAFLNPLTVIEYNNTLKGQIQDKHNTRELSYSNDGDMLEIGTVNNVDTTGGAPTFTVPVQSLEYLGGWIDIVDKENNFDTNPVTIDFDEFDTFEGEFDTDFVCNKKGATCRVWYTDDDFGWTAEEFNIPVHRCSLTKSSDQSVNTVTWTSIIFDQENYDVGGLHDTVTNNSRITIQEAGEYRIIYHLKHDANDKSSYQTRIYKNGSGVIEGTCDIGVGSKDASAATLSATSTLITFAQDDYVELQFYHDTDGTEDVLSSNTFYEIQRAF